DVLGDARDLGCPQVGHALVVLGVVGDVAGDVGLLDAADPVGEARRARDGPGPGQRVGVAQVGHEPVVVVRLVCELHADVGQVGDVGQLPRLRPVGQVAV